MKNNYNLVHTIKPLLVTLLVAFPPIAAPQGANSAIPGAGSILQQMQPLTPAVPQSSQSDLRVERDAASALPAGAPFLVKTILITGNKKISTATLHALVADGEGKNLTLIQLGELAGRITDYYRRQGFPLARAIIPAQSITAGVVNIQVIVARYDKISFDNRSRTNNALIQATLEPLQKGQDIAQAPLDRALLLLSDIPGVVVTATLKPAETVGSSELIVSATPGAQVSGNVVLDGYGSRYTGRERIGGTVNINDPLRLRSSDVLSLTALSSGKGLNYGRLGYEVVINGQGTRLGGAHSALSYELGESLGQLNVHGTAQVTSLWAKHPFIRSRDVNLYGQIQYDRLQLRDRIDRRIDPLAQTDRNLQNVTLSIAGDARDTVLAGGVNSGTLSLTTGNVDFKNQDAKAIDAAGTGTQGRFSKVNFNVSRLQGLSPRNGLYFNFAGQWASKNLDPSQKMTVGGPYTVRAYDVGAVSGDSGYSGTVEYRYDLGSAWQGQWQAIAFVDSAHVKLNKNFSDSPANSADLSGAGLGLNWIGPNRWTAKVSLAKPIGSTPLQVGASNSMRAWVEIGKSF